MKQSLLLVAVAVITSCFAARAETFEWTGAAAQGGKAAWTNAANWKIAGSDAVPTRCPGALLAEHFGHDNIVNKTLETFWKDYPEEAGQMWADWEARQDTVIFAAGNGADVTIDMDNLLSISNVIFRGATSPTYTFGTVNRWQNFGQRLPLGINGRLTVEQDVVNLPQFPYGVAVGIRSYGYSAFYVTFVNETSETLVLNALGWPICWKYEKEPYLHYTFEGEGGFKVTGFNNNMRTNRKFVHLKQKGLFELSGEMSQYSYFVALDFDPPEGVTSELNLLSGSTITFQPDGNNSAGIYAQGNARLYGEGTIKYNGRHASNGRVDTGTVLAAKAGRTLEIDTKLAHLGAGTKLTELCALGTQGSDIFSSANVAAWAGTVRFGANAANSSAVDFFFLTGGTVEYSDAAQLGVATSVNLTGNGTFAYTGAGETLDKPISVIAIAKTETLNQTTLPARARIEQKGTGDWTIGDLGSTEAGAEVTLANDTEFSGVVAGEIAGTLAVTKTGSGRWEIDGTITAAGGIKLMGGTLAFGGADKALTSLTVAGDATIEMVEGAAVTLSAAPEHLGGTLNVTGAGSFRLPATMGGLPAASWIKFNGQPASVDVDGSIVPSGSLTPTVEIAAKGGVISGGADDLVGITTEGTEGPITLASSPTSVKALLQQTAVPATVALGAEETLSVRYLSVGAGKASLTIGANAADGAFAAASDGLILENNDAESVLSILAPMTTLSSLAIQKLGCGKALLPQANGGAWSATVDLGGGEVAFGTAEKAIRAAIDAADKTTVFAYSHTAAGVATVEHSASSTAAPLKLSGETASGEQLVLKSSDGTVNVHGGAFTVGDIFLEAKDAETTARFVIDGGAKLVQAETNNVFRIGSTVVGKSGGLSEVVISNATFGLKLAGNGNDNNFADTYERTLRVGGPYGDGLLRVGEGAVVTNRLNLGHAKHVGAMYMDGGSFLAYGTYAEGGAAKYNVLGCGDWSNVGHGYLELKGGAYTNGSSMSMMNCYANGILAQFGGIFGGMSSPGCNVDKAQSYLTLVGGQSKSAACPSMAVMYIGGGVFDPGFNTFMLDQGSSGEGVITVDGDAYANFGCKFLIGRNTDRRDACVLNLNGGTIGWHSIGILKTYADYCEDGVRTKCPFFVNFNGGTLSNATATVLDVFPAMPGAAAGLGLGMASRVTVFEKGGVIDTTGRDWNLCQPIEAPTGKGIAAVPWSYSEMRLIAPPVVRITGDGYGASAFALLDSANGTVTNVLVTSHGCDYTTATASFFVGETKLGEVACVLADNVAGPLTKKGGGVINVRAQIRTPEFVITSGGGVYSYVDDAVSPETVLRLDGGTFVLNNGGGVSHPSSPKAIVGTGGTLSGSLDGYVRMQGLSTDGLSGINFDWTTNKVVGATTIDARTLVAKNRAGEIPTYAPMYIRALEFAESATIAFTHTEALDPADRRYTVFRFAPQNGGATTSANEGFSGMPTLVGELPPNWAFKKVGRELRLSYKTGLMMIVR